MLEERRWDRAKDILGPCLGLYAKADPEVGKPSETAWALLLTGLGAMVGAAAAAVELHLTPRTRKKRHRRHGNATLESWKTPAPAGICERHAEMKPCNLTARSSEPATQRECMGLFNWPLAETNQDPVVTCEGCGTVRPPKDTYRCSTHGLTLCNTAWYRRRNIFLLCSSVQDGRARAPPPPAPARASSAAASPSAAAPCEYTCMSSSFLQA